MDGKNGLLKRLLIVKQVLLVSPLGRIQRTVWRICILTVGCKGIRTSDYLLITVPLFFAAEFCLVHLLLSRHPGMLFQHFVECVFHFNSFEKHQGTSLIECIKNVKQRRLVCQQLVRKARLRSLPPPLLPPEVCQNQRSDLRK